MTINTGTVTTNIPVTIAELTLNGGQVQLNQLLHVGTMAINGGSILGDAGLRIDGNLVLRGGTINNTGSGPDGFVVAGEIIKRGYGRATLAPFGGDGDYVITIEQGEFRYGNGGLGTTVGAVTIAVPEFARIEASNLRILSDDLYLDNARGFVGTGALVNRQSLSTISGDIFLGDVGAVIGLVPGGIGEGVMTILGGVHGGSLAVAGRGSVNIESDNSTYTGPTVLGAAGEQTLLRLRGTGRLPSTSGIDVGGHATLRLDNENQIVDDRLPDDSPIVLRGGTLELVSSSSTPSFERVGALRIMQGASNVSTGSWRSRLTFKRFERDTTATVEFQRRDDSNSDGPRISFVEAPTTVNNILGGWATVNDLDFASYDTSLGVVQLGDSIARPAQISGATLTDHVRVVNMTPAPLTENRSIATLTTMASLDVDLGGHMLTLSDGGLIATGASSVRNGQLTAGHEMESSVLYLHNVWRDVFSQPGNGNISASIVDNSFGGIVSLVKAGSVTTRLSGVNTYSGKTVIQEGTLLFEAEGALPDGNVLAVDGGTASLQYQPTAVKHLNQLSLQQGGYVFSPKAASTQQSAVEIDVDEYLLESGTIGISLAGDGVLRKVGEGVVEMTYESPNFTGPVIVEQGLLVAGSRSVETVPRALGLGETTIMPGGTLVHSAVLPNVGYMRLDAKLNLEGGDVGIGPSIRTSRWDFNGAWRVTANSRLLLFDPRGNDEITTPQGNLTTPTVNLLQDLTMSDGVSLTVLGAGLVQFAGGLSLSGDASIVADEGMVNISAISATTNGATLSLRGKGDFQVPRTLSTTGAHFTIEIASDAKATPATNGAFSVDNGVTLVVNGHLSNSQSLNMLGGKVAGVGSLGEVLNIEGELSPGNSVGVLTVGDYQQGIGGILTVELFGGPDDTSDQLRAHIANLTGTIRTLLAPGADVKAGDAFNVVVADQILATGLTLQPQGFVGRLDVVTLSTGPDAGKQALRLLVAPEPATLVMSICTVILLCGFKTRSLANRLKGQVGRSAKRVSPTRTQSLSFSGR